MKILVCVKQVPDTSGRLAVNPDGTLNRALMQTIINPDGDSSKYGQNSFFYDAAEGLLTAIVLVLAMNFVLPLFSGEVNYWRVSSLTLGLHGILCGFLYRSNIPYYFPNLHIFMAVSILNGALVGELCYGFSANFTLKIGSVMAGFMFILMILIAVFAGDDHSLFSVNSLYLMDLFIFLPHLIPCAIRVLSECLGRKKLFVFNK